MPKGSLWIGDPGYVVLVWLKELSEQGVFCVLRSTIGTILWHDDGRVEEILDLLRKTSSKRSMCRCSAAPPRRSVPGC